jgi:serine/threonine-protein kinase
MTGQPVHIRPAMEEFLAPTTAPLATPSLTGAGSDAPPSAQVGRFRLLGEIDRGGMGVVLRALDPAIGRDVALKVVRPDLANDLDVQRRFLREVRLAGQLQHPGIAPVYDLGTLPDGRPYFAMKLIEGDTLAVLLCERGDPGHDLPRFLGYFEAICQTVGYAHARGVIHRDLKPLNVMVGAFGEVQVMDWGLAKVLHGELQATDAPLPRVVLTTQEEGLSQADAVVGTAGYMAPEQVHGNPESIDKRADVFGLGSILCEILTGAPPFHGAVVDVLLRTHQGELSDAFARLERSGADADLVRLARACLAANPDERLADGKAVA